MSDILMPEDDLMTEDNLQANNMEPEIDKDRLASVLWEVIRKFETEDELSHRIYFKDALKSEHYWNHRQHIFREFTTDSSFKWKEEDDASEDYTANIYRPNGESIIAAMSASLPQINFYPDDAENSEDIVTANAYHRISTLLQKHNKAHLLIIRALFILYNQSFVAFYNYSKKSSKYGTYKKEVYEEQENVVQKQVCPTCSSDITTLGPPYECSTCGSVFNNPEIISEIEVINQLVGVTDESKTRECIKAFGPLNVRVAPYIQDMEDTPYLVLEYECHSTLAKAEFQDFKDKFVKGSSALSDEWREGRSELYKGEYDHLDTWKIVWLRPWAYNYVGNSEDEYFQHLTTNYPDGVKLIFINNILADISNEKLDDHWSVTQSPLSSYIHAESLGKGGIPIQDATNVLMNLSMDTVAHGIPQTFADSQLIDFEAYRRAEQKPGMIFPTRPISAGQTINNLIHTTRTATLSQEVKEVRDSLQQMGQLATGAFPSIYGGVVAGSRTASEYAQSRAQALQRLSITWTLIKEVWADVMSKSCVAFARNLKEDGRDERAVKKSGNEYINVWIRRAELTGKIGSVEPEIDEQLPTSWAQQRDVLLRLIEINSPMINEVISLPENAQVVKGALGMKDIKIPGYDDRLKQLSEITQMLQGIQVNIDQQLDNHIIEAEICRSFLIGEVGRDLKNTNIQLYSIIYMHFMQHNQIAQAMMQAQMQAENNPEQAKEGEQNA